MSGHKQNQALIRWDEQQQAVIDEISTARIVVEAGPGMGKTAVACARVANLVNKGLGPANIWLVSFTRTAVKEIRDRINNFVDHEYSSASIRISTVDSHVWYLRQGFDYVESHELFGSYEANIVSVIEMLKAGHEGLLEYIENMQHLIVDEAQDLVGNRSQLLFELISRLPDSCGITIFVDSAQAIYGFADDETYNSDPIKSSLLMAKDLNFKDVSLTTIHRTNSKSLKTIFSDVRDFVLDSSVSGLDKYDIVRDSIFCCADETETEILDDRMAGRDDVLVLFRRRAEVLLASSLLHEQKIEHRLRMSGLPAYIPAWVGHLFNTFENRYLNESEFLKRWETKFPEPTDDLPPPGKAWKLFVQLAGDNRRRIDMRLLRNVLSRTPPPVELCNSELGTSGPVLSTIHASKGREAPHVYLMLPKSANDKEENIDEEVRVLFVGATRGKKSLHLGEGYQWPSRSLEKGGRAYRIFSKEKKFRMQVEIGREYDLDVISPASRVIHDSPTDALVSQERMYFDFTVPRPAIAYFEQGADFTYRLSPTDAIKVAPIATLSQTLNSDLFSICNQIENISKLGRFRPHERINFLHIIGVRTIAISEDDPRCALMHRPFSNTGIILAPIITGFPTLLIKKQKYRN